MMVRKGSALLAVLALCSATSMVFAADHVHGKMDKDYNVVVTATRSESLLENVPSDIVVVGKQEIEEREYNTLKEALQSVPGIVFETDPHGGQNVTIRGAASRHTLVLVDGKRITADLTKARANVLTFERFSMNDVERIEVVKGPNSALYGSEAMGGVINIITKKEKKPSATWNTEMLTREKSDGVAYHTSLAMHSGNEGKWNSSLTIGKRKNIAIKKQSGDSTYQGSRTPFHIDVTYQASKNHSFDVSYDYIKEELMQSNTRSLPVLDLFTPEFKDMTTKMASLNYTGHFGHTDANARIYVNTYEDKYHKDYISKAKNPMMAKAINKKGLSDWDSIFHKDVVLEAQFNTALDASHLLTYGITHQKETAEGTRIGGKNLKTVRKETKTILKPIIKNGMPTRVPAERTQELKGVTHTTTSAYIQDEWEVSDTLLFIPALRYDHSNAFGDNWSPKLGATYKANPDTRVKVNVGRGYSLPGITEMYHSWEMFGPNTIPHNPFGFWFDGNPNLKPETSTNFDISLEKDFHNTSVKATYFWNRIKNFIGIESVGLDGNPLVKGAPPKLHAAEGGDDMVFSYFNSGSVTLQGVELSTEHRFNSHWSGYMNYTYLHAIDDETDEMITNRAKHSITAGVTYKNQDWIASLWGNAYINYLDGVSSSKSDGPEMKNITVWNFLVSKQVAENAKLYVGVNNIFNESEIVRDVEGLEYRFGINVTF